MRTHRCPALGCNATIPAWLLLCKEHWARVPRVLQLQVRRAYEEGKGLRVHPTQEYTNAAGAAIRTVNEKLTDAAARRRQHQDSLQLTRGGSNAS